MRAGALGIAAALLAAGTTTADETSLAEALKGGTYSIALRYRYERVEDDALAKDAAASTLRTAVSYESGRVHRFFGALELENVADLGYGDRHANGENGVSDRPTISDPPGTEVNTVLLGYEGWRETRLLAGRQRITFDDQRFVGDVGWRQNHQAYDGIRLTQESIPRTRIDYAFVRNVNTVTEANRPGDLHLLQAEIDADRAGSVAVYLFRLDFEPANAGLSTETIGARWAKKIEAGKLSLPLRAEIARQRDVGDNPDEVDADYLRLLFGVEWRGWRTRAGYERLGGESGRGSFSTPLATLHAHNGWADKFLTTPAEGLEDLFLSAGYVWERVTLEGIFHRFSADSGGARYGDEIDAHVVWRAPWEQVFGLKLALYDATDFSTDTDKLWLYTSYRF